MRHPADRRRTRAAMPLAAPATTTLSQGASGFNGIMAWTGTAAAAAVVTSGAFLKQTSRIRKRCSKPLSTPGSANRSCRIRIRQLSRRGRQGLIGFVHDYIGACPQRRPRMDVLRNARLERRRLTRATRGTRRLRAQDDRSGRPVCRSARRGGVRSEPTGVEPRRLDGRGYRDLTRHPRDRTRSRTARNVDSRLSTASMLINADD